MVPNLDLIWHMFVLVAVRPNDYDKPKNDQHTAVDGRLWVTSRKSAGQDVKPHQKKNAAGEQKKDANYVQCNSHVVSKFFV